MAKSIALCAGMLALLAVSCEKSTDVDFSALINGRDNIREPGTLAISEEFNTTLNSVTITWEKIPMATEYRLYRSENGSAWEIINTLTDPNTITYTDDNGLTPATQYQYKVGAYNSSGEKITTMLPALTCPAAPEIVSITATSASSIAIIWVAATGASGYKIYRSTDGLDWGGPITEIMNPDTTFYVDPDLESAKQYYYKTSAYNDSGETILDTSDSGLTFPVAPVLNTEIVSTPNAITFTWSKVTGADGYRIYRSDYGITPFDVISNSETTTYSNSSLEPAMQYTWQVAAYNSSGETRSAEKPTLTRPSAPNATATATSTSNITITWDAVTGATGYNIYRNTSAEGPFTDANKINPSPVIGTSQPDSGRATATRYYYQVEALNAGGGTRSITVSATTRLPTPAAPTVDRQLATGMKLSWPSVVGATTYRVYYSTANIFDVSGQYQTVTAMTGNTQQYTVIGLTTDTVYWFWITAHTDSTYSEPSLPESRKTILSNITINFENPADPVMSPKMSTLQQQNSYTITVDAADWIDYQWRIDGMVCSTDSSYTITSWQLSVGPHTLTVIVEKDGVPHSTSINFTVVNN
jgi:fibronectin type 3 domain-containing protein